MFRRQELLERYESAVRAYRNAVCKLAQARGFEFKKASSEADRLHRECEAARKELERSGDVWSVT